jgi:hypothetical protein
MNLSSYFKFRFKLHFLKCDFLGNKFGLISLPSVHRNCITLLSENIIVNPVTQKGIKKDGYANGRHCRNYSKTEILHMQHLRR